MDDCAALVETMMQWMSKSPTARVIDREVGDLGQDLMAGGTSAVVSSIQRHVVRSRRGRAEAGTLAGRSCLPPRDGQSGQSGYS